MFLSASVGILPGLGVSVGWRVENGVGSVEMCSQAPADGSGKVTVLPCSWVGMLQLTHLWEKQDSKIWISWGPQMHRYNTSGEEPQEIEEAEVESSIGGTWGEGVVV